MNTEKWEYYLNSLDSHITGGLNAPSVYRRCLKDSIPIYTPEGYFLDAGCGSGEEGRLLEEKGYRVEYIDWMPQDDKIAKVDIHDLPFEDKTFDAVLCNNTLEHVLSPYVAFLEFNRVLKKGGIFYLIIPPATTSWIMEKTHISVLTEDQIKNFINKTNFKQLDCIPGHDSDTWILEKKDDFVR